ncbi:MAG: HlyD family secretion protein [Bacteroidales bacterium]
MKKWYFILLLSAITGCRDGNGKYDATGRFEATELIVSAEATGKVMQLDIEEGIKVDSGEILGYIDTAQLNFQKRRLLESNLAVKARRSDVSKQIAVLKQQIKNLEKEKVRAESLVNSNAGNRKALDDVNAQIFTLEKQIDAQQSLLEKGNLSADKEGAAIEIQIAQTEDLIKKSIISAPISGTIMVKYANRGEFKATGQPLFKIAHLDNITLRAYVTNESVQNIKTGDSVKVFTGFDQASTRSYGGIIRWISEEAEFTPKNIQSRDQRSNLVYAVKIDVGNDGYIKTGMYGDVKFINK